MECAKCGEYLHEENQCCGEGNCCNVCCACEEGISDPECQCSDS